jgi:hypothetical protein
MMDINPDDDLFDNAIYYAILTIVKGTAARLVVFFRGIACRKMDCRRKNTVITMESSAHAHPCKCGD